MTYGITPQQIADKYHAWKQAMLLELHNAIGLEYDIENAEQFQIDSVLKFNILISGLSGLLHTRYRGEARYHSNPCLPIIARRKIENVRTDFEIDEVYRYKYSNSSKDFHIKLDDNDITWWMLTQHYSGYDTRLLDISRNPLVALYFACEKHPDKDGYVYVFHSMDKTSLPLNPSYKSYEDHIKDPNNYYLENKFVYMRPSVAIDRISRQEGEFLWIKNYANLQNEGLFETKQIIPIIIKKEHKQRLLRELKDPQGINFQFLNYL